MGNLRNQSDQYYNKKSVKFWLNLGGVADPYGHMLVYGKLNKNQKVKTSL